MDKSVKVSKCGLLFKKDCPEKWQAMDLTDFENVRYCQQCRKKVYLCNTPELAIAHAKQGRCIAFEYEDGMTIGEVDNAYSRLES